MGFLHCFSAVPKQKYSKTKFMIVDSSFNTIHSSSFWYNPGCRGGGGELLVMLDPDFFSEFIP